MNTHAFPTPPAMHRASARGRGSRLAGLVGLSLLASLANHPAAAVTVAVTPAAAVAPVGSEVALAISVSDLGDRMTPAIGAISLDLSFDSALVAFSRVRYGDPLLGNQLDAGGTGSFPQTDTGTSGTVSLSDLSFDAAGDLASFQADSFVFATVDVVLLAPGTSPLELMKPVLSDENGAGLLGFTIANSSLTAVPVPSAALLFLSSVLALSLVKRRRSRVVR